MPSFPLLNFPRWTVDGLLLAQAWLASSTLPLPSQITVAKRIGRGTLCLGCVGCPHCQRPATDERSHQPLSLAPWPSDYRFDGLSTPEIDFLPSPAGCEAIPRHNWLKAVYMLKADFIIDLYCCKRTGTQCQGTECFFSPRTTRLHCEICSFFSFLFLQNITHAPSPTEPLCVFKCHQSNKIRYTYNHHIP